MPDADAYDYGALVVLQHSAHAGPSAATSVLDARANHRPWRLVDLAVGAPLPGLEGVRGVISLGGSMGVHDRGEHGWIDGEVELLARAVAQDVPVLGICLGAQLLATALGGAVERLPTPEVGYLELTRTEAASDDDVAAGWPDGSTALFLHEDEVTRLPAGAVTVLDGSVGVAAWHAGDGRAYGVQFHPEVDAQQVASWCELERDRALVTAAGRDPDELAAEASRRDAFVRATGLSLIGRWLDAVVGRDDPAPPRRRREPAA